MKKGIFAFCIFCLAGWTWADTPTAQKVSVSTSSIYMETPYFTGYIPVESGISAVSLVDLLPKHDHTPYVGAETPFAGLFKGHIVANAGAVTSLQGIGTPFLSGHIQLPNPLPQFPILSELNLGGFGARNFNQGFWMAGLKVAKKFF